MIQEYFGINLSNTVRIALPLTDIGTIERFEPKKICQIPGVAPFWLGVANQKGALVWVLDGDRFLELESKSDRPETRVTTVILNRRSKSTKRGVAWRVKNLEGVITLDPNQYHYWPDYLPSRFQNLFTAVVKHNNQPILILDSLAFFQAIRS